MMTDDRLQRTDASGSGEGTAGDDDTPVFRAVGTPTRRRGIRLESIYWDALKQMAKSRGETLGTLVGAIADRAEGTNLASLLRVRVARWLLERTDRLAAISRSETANAIIQASPSPAFALTEDKRIVYYNPAFLNLIQAHFVGSGPNLTSKGLRLSLDTPLEEVIVRLSSGEASTLSSGYVLGVDGQRLRGTVNIVMAPVHAQAMIIAFVARN